MFGHINILARNNTAIRKRKIGASKSLEFVSKEPSSFSILMQGSNESPENLLTSKIAKIPSKSSISSTPSSASISVTSSLTSCSESSDASVLNDVYSTHIYTRIPSMSETLEVEDQFQKRWIASRHSQPFYNGHNWHAASQQVAIELAVCGGRMYQMMLGQHYPAYSIAKSEDEEGEFQYYRVCEKIDAVAEGVQVFSENFPCDGLFSGWTASLVLGDNDISNILLNRTKNVVRIDPEFCFTHFFRDDYNHADIIYEELKYLYYFNDLNVEQIKLLHSDRKEHTIPEHMQMLNQVKIPPFLTECFKHHMFNHPATLQYLLNHQLRQKEITDFLESFLNKPILEFKKIIDTTISHQQIKEAVWNEFQKRHHNIKLAYQKLKNPNHSLGLFSATTANKPDTTSHTPTFPA